MSNRRWQRRWVFFAAHSCDPVYGSGGHQPLQPIGETFSLRDPVVHHIACFVVEPRLFGPAA